MLHLRDACMRALRALYTSASTSLLAFSTSSGRDMSARRRPITLTRLRRRKIVLDIPQTHASVPQADVQRSSLAGGVAISSVVSIFARPFTAMVIGFIGGAVCSTAHHFLRRLLEKKLSITDTVRHRAFRRELEPAC